VDLEVDTPRSTRDAGTAHLVARRHLAADHMHSADPDRLVRSWAVRNFAAQVDLCHKNHTDGLKTL
jgi:hypothetical protein